MTGIPQDGNLIQRTLLTVYFCTNLVGTLGRAARVGGRHGQSKTDLSFALAEVDALSLVPA